uniref:C2H2-type domain-containing protein n=1 Tax=Globodera pallida TaxID=36090 RepID=A0A183BYP3_GLOPA
MRERVWNPALEGRDDDKVGAEGAEGPSPDEKSLSLANAAAIGPFLFAQLRQQFFQQPPRPFRPLFPFAFPPPAFVPPPPVANRPTPTAIPPPFLMVAAMMAAAPRAVHGGTFVTPPQQLFRVFGGSHPPPPGPPNGIQTFQQCQKPSSNNAFTWPSNGQDAGGETSRLSGQNRSEMNKKAKKRKKVPTKMPKMGQSADKDGSRAEDEQQNSKKCNNPIVQMVLNTAAEDTTTTAVNFNTCAICGAQFRLTGDLIQHARTNHRQSSRYDRNAQRASIAEEAQKLCRG